MISEYFSSVYISTGISLQNFFKQVVSSDVKSISVFDGNTGKRFIIDDLTEIKYIVENIQNTEMERDKVSVGYSGYAFRISFNSSNGKEPLKCRISALSRHKKRTVPKAPVLKNSSFKCAARGSNPGHPD